MSASDRGDGQAFGAELTAVEEAAAARLRAETEGDREAAGVAAEAMLAAATAAMSSGYPLGEIARAEVRGKEHIREELREDALKRVERNGRRMREAGVEYHRAIARAVRLGLSMREIAHAAGVTHGTIRAISNRLMGADSSVDLVANDTSNPPPMSESEAT